MVDLSVSVLTEASQALNNNTDDKGMAHPLQQSAKPPCQEAKRWTCRMSPERGKPVLLPLASS